MGKLTDVAMADRILLDANTILNAAFVSESWSIKSVSCAIKNGVTVIVGHDTVREAVTVARRMALELGKQTDPEGIIESFIRHFRLIQISASATTDVPKEIPAHDTHVYCEADSAKAAILTSDSELWLKCKQAGYEAVFPLEIIRQFDGHSLATTVFGVPMNPKSGSVFVRGYPINWGGHVSDGLFTLIDFPGFLWLYYNAGSSQWVAELEGEESLAITQEITDDSLQTVSLSWRFGDQIYLRVGGAHAPALRKMDAALPGKLSEARIGSHRTGQHYWSGAIYVSIFNDRPISKDAWRLYLQDRDLVPNPFDMDRLRGAIDRRLS